MENKIINIGVVAEVAEALGELKKDIVFVGGAVGDDQTCALIGRYG